MSNSLRVPMRRVPTRLTTGDGAERDVTVFLAEGERVSDLFSRATAFIPMEERGRVRFYATGAIACLVADPDEDDAFHGLSCARRAVTLELLSGVKVVGELRFIPDEGQRIQEALNDDAPSLAIHARGRVTHVARAHVLSVEEDQDHG